MGGEFPWGILRRPWLKGESLRGKFSDKCRTRWETLGDGIITSQTADTPRVHRTTTDTGEIVRRPVPFAHVKDQILGSAPLYAHFEV